MQRYAFCVVGVLWSLLPFSTFTRRLLWQGFIFVDRDPKHFGVILNYLRDGFAVLPRDEQALREIMVEAAYYKVG